MNSLLTVVLIGSIFTSASLAQNSDAPEAQYDPVGIYPATSFLNPGYLATDYYRIDSSVYNDGIYNTWQVFSKAGTYEVTGNERLMNLARELAAIATIESESNAKRFAEAMKGAGEQQLKGAQNVLRNPVKTAKAIPQGAGRFFGRVGNTVKHAVDGNLDTADENANPGDTAKRLIGVDAVKRQLAAELGVNPYSSNAALQKALNDAAWAESLGKATMNIASGMVVPPGVGAAMKGIGITDFLTSDQVKLGPDDLEKQNREKLTAMGVQADAQDRLFANPSYDPWSLSGMINAIESLNLQTGSAVFFELAGTATSDLDAYFFFRTAQLIANYHKSIAPILALEGTNRVVLCKDNGGKLIAPLWIDYVAWTPAVEASAQRLQERANAESAAGVVILASGDFTPRAAGNLQQLGFEVVSRAFAGTP